MNKRTEGIISRFKSSRRAGFLIITLIYMAAVFIGTVVFNGSKTDSLYLRFFIADLAATLFVFLAGCIFRNASVYDPYWSVAPIVILTGFIFHQRSFDNGSWLLLCIVCIWGIRLTYNWAVTFKNLNHQDWRYDYFKNKFPLLYPLINLTGIHLFPTVVVFTVLIPAFDYLRAPAINAYTVIGAIICLAAVALQYAADTKMQNFRRTNTDPARIIDAGVWKYARHPNYFAEIMMWWGVYVIMLSVNLSSWQYAAGPLLNTLMFLLISIPLAEKRLSDRKRGYAAYKQSTRLFLPLPLRQKPEEQQSHSLR